MSAAAPTVDALPEAARFTADLFPGVDDFSVAPPTLGSAAPYVQSETLSPKIYSVGGFEFSISTTASKIAISTIGGNAATSGAEFGLELEQSGPLINVDDFRANFAGIDGSGFAVAILDTGANLNHDFFGPDLDSNGIADRIVYQEDFADNDMDASDVNGHGTNVASISISSGDPINGNYTGMAPGADIIILKVFKNSGAGFFFDIEQALQWVVTNQATYNIASVNMSLSDGGNYQSATQQSQYGIDDEIAALAAQNVITVSASGNSFFQFNSVQGVAYPAADPNSLSVGAVYDADIGVPPPYSGGAIALSTGAERLTPFSQRHATLSDVFAPGANITGAGLNDIRPPSGSGSGYTSTYAGTSQASPHIAGIVALAQQLADQVLGRRLTVLEFQNLLATVSDGGTSKSINDGDDEDDNVTNTNINYPLVDVQALGDAILAISPATISQQEGDAGPTDYIFTVTRTGDLTNPTSVLYDVTGSGTHEANGADIVGGVLPTGIQVDFIGGQATANITVSVNGDVMAEQDEGFTVTLHTPTNATISTGAASGTIEDDDTPSLTLLDDDFNDGNFDNWVIDDQGTPIIASNWSVVNQEVSQSANYIASGTGFQDNRLGTTLIWNGAGSQGWQDYTFQASFRSTDDDGMGFLFNYADDQNYYKVDFANQYGFSKIFVMEAGVESTLASVSDFGFTPGAQTDFEVTISGDQITVLRDSQDVFGGPVQDAGLTAKSGTVGLYNWANAGSFFDDVVVTGTTPPPPPPDLAISPATISQQEGDAGPTDYIFTVTRTGDLTNPTSVLYDVTGSGTHEANGADIVGGVLPTGIQVDFIGGQATANITVSVNGDVMAEQDEGFTVTLHTPTNATISTGAASGTIEDDDTPSLTLLDDDFNDGNFDNWVIDDQGTPIIASNWSVVNQEVSQSANYIASGTGFQDNRLGTTLIWNGAGSQGWQDYTFQASFRSTDDDGMGFLFNYADDQNYYKVDFANQYGFSKIFVMEAGVESTLASVSDFGFTPGAQTDFEVTISGDQITVLRNSQDVFGGPVQDASLTAKSGTVGLYNWVNTGSFYDNVLVTDIAAPSGAGAEQASGDSAAVNSQLDGLVSAMAAFDPPSTGLLDLSQSDDNEFESVIDTTS